jgi:hypothetical protein
MQMKQLLEEDNPLRRIVISVLSGWPTTKAIDPSSQMRTRTSFEEG